MRTIAIMNNKGGVGKTVTAINLADILVRVHNKRVLLVDCDGQCNLTHFLIPEITEIEAATTADMLTGSSEPLWEHNVWPVFPGLGLVPAADWLYELDISKFGESDEPEWEIRPRALLDFRKAVEEDGEIDFLIYDCPPGFTTSSCAALLAADEVIIPAVLDGFSFDGIRQMQAQIRTLRRANKDVKIAGVLINQWHRAEHIAESEKLLRSMKVPVFHTVIRRTDKVYESTFAREPLTIYSPNSAAGRDFRCWVEELIGEEGTGDGSEV